MINKMTQIGTKKQSGLYNHNQLGTIRSGTDLSQTGQRFPALIVVVCDHFARSYIIYLNSHLANTVI